MKSTITAALLLFTAVFSSRSFAKDCTPADGPLCFYGFLIPTLSVATEGVESFSQPNQSAFTAAANPALLANRTAARSSFQVAQSRIGFVVRPEAKTNGRLEFDFIDFTKDGESNALVDGSFRFAKDDINIHLRSRR